MEIRKRREKTKTPSILSQNNHAIPKPNCRTTLCSTSPFGQSPKSQLFHFCQTPFFVPLQHSTSQPCTNSPQTTPQTHHNTLPCYHRQREKERELHLASERKELLVSVLDRVFEGTKGKPCVNLFCFVNLHQLQTSSKPQHHHSRNHCNQEYRHQSLREPRGRKNSALSCEQVAL